MSPTAGKVLYEAYCAATAWVGLTPTPWRRLSATEKHYWITEAARA